MSVCLNPAGCHSYNDHPIVISKATPIVPLSHFHHIRDKETMI